MIYLVITGSPKEDGLCHSVMSEIKRGAADGGAEVEILTAENIERCRCCGDGWGTCIKDGSCEHGGDGFAKAQEAVRRADALCIISPVYWAETSELLKCFLDRLRRCDSMFSKDGALDGKQVLLVAVPGGSGGGALPCLEQLERFCWHTKAAVFDYISVNRWNSDYKKQSAYSAAKAMAEGRKTGETV